MSNGPGMISHDSDSFDLSASTGHCRSLPKEQNLPTSFLHAQTRRYLGDERADWDNIALLPSVKCSLPVNASRARSLGPDVGCQIMDICARLRNIFSSREKYVKFLGYRNDVAQDILDLLQKLLDHAPLESQFRAIVTVSLVRLSRKAKLYPRCFSLNGVIEKEEYPHSAGGFGDVYKAYYDGEPMCLKICRVYQYSDRSLLYETFYHEAIVWGQLFHPNVLPFYGIHSLGDFRKSLCLVSPWISNGNVLDFLNEKPYIDRIPLICDIAEGLKYLHTNGIVHGDLKNTNILVTDSERACLTDFGLSYISDNSGLTGHALSSNYDPSRASFEAPELLDLDLEFIQKTPASDVYAFGMVCFEILTGQRPFGNSGPMLVYRKTLKGEKPSRPSDTKCLERGLTDCLWDLLQSCWSFIPQDRPKATHISRSLPHVKDRPTDKWTRFQRPDFDTSSGYTDQTIARALSHLQWLV